MPKPPANYVYVRRTCRVPERLFQWSRRAAHDGFPSHSPRVLRTALHEALGPLQRVSPILKGRAPPVSETRVRVDVWYWADLLEPWEYVGVDLSATLTAGLEHLKASGWTAAAHHGNLKHWPQGKTTMNLTTIGVTLHPDTYARLQGRYESASATALSALVLCYGDTQGRPWRAAIEPIPAPRPDRGLFGSRPRMPRGGPRRRSLTLALPEAWVAWLRRPGCNASATVDQALQLMQALD